MSARLMVSNVPVVGAIMNMVSQGSAAGYSLNYYDKSYQNYYTMPDVEEEEAEGKGAQGDGGESEGAGDSENSK